MKAGDREGVKDASAAGTPVRDEQFSTDRPFQESAVHIVTKVLIVFVAIVGLIVAALSMAFAANANAIRSSFNDERARRTTAEANYAANVAQSAQASASNTQQTSALSDELSKATSEISRLMSERTTLRSQVESAQAEAAAIRIQISQLGATVDTQAALIKNYRDEVNATRDDLFGARKKEVELQDRVNDLESANEVLQQGTRAMKEQLEETKVQMQTQGAGAAGAGMTATSSPVAREMAGPIVRARVTESFRSPAGDDMVVIDQGSNRGLKADTQMTVARGETFVASIVLVTVEPNRAVGRVTLSGKSSGAVATGDTVLSRLE